MTHILGNSAFLEEVMHNTKMHFVMVLASKAQQLIQGLTAAGDEGQQLSAVIELCQVCQKFIVYHRHLSPVGDSYQK